MGRVTDVHCGMWRSLEGRHVLVWSSTLFRSRCTMDARCVSLIMSRASSLQSITANHRLLVMCCKNAIVAIACLTPRDWHRMMEHPTKKVAVKSLLYSGVALQSI
eukprot:3022854-Amphidinium_carterae.1